jgi:membrane protein implicated in regulation of membrane protease activity
MWSRYVVLKYLLLQLPGLAMLVLILIMLRHWMNIPAWAVWVFTSLWIIKDMILFPFVWRAYEKGNPKTIIGTKGTAVDRLSPSGHVRINNELWRARAIKSDSVIEKDEIVTVEDSEGLTLIVKAEENKKA